jgi:hypothetical protein
MEDPGWQNGIVRLAGDGLTELQRVYEEVGISLGMTPRVARELMKCTGDGFTDRTCAVAPRRVCWNCRLDLAGYV